MTVDFSSEILLAAVREEDNIFPLLKGKNFQSGILYPMKILQEIKENQDILR